MEAIFPLIKSASDALVASLATEEPQHCAKYYVACTRYILRTPNQFQLLLRYRPDLFDCVMRFLTRTRTDAEFAALEKRVVQCNCSLDTDFSRRAHVCAGTSIASFSNILNSLSTLIGYCFIDVADGKSVIRLEDARKKAKKAAKTHQRLPWPEKTKDLFVYPSRDIALAMWTLWNRYKHVDTLRLLTALMAAGGSTFISEIYTIPTFPSEYISHLLRLQPLVSSEYEAFHYMFNLLDLVVGRFQLKDTPRLVFWIPYTHTLLLLLTLILETFDPEFVPPPSLAYINTPDLLQRIARIGSDFLWQFTEGTPCPDIVATTHMYSPKIRELACSDDSRLEDNPDLDHLDAAFEIVSQFAQSDACSAPGCRETHVTQDRLFPTCGGCRVVSYCSKECQKVAWKHPAVPHKSLCKELGAYASKMPINWKKARLPRREVMLAWCQAAGVTVAEAKNIDCKVKEVKMQEGFWLDGKLCIKEKDTPWLPCPF